DRTRAPLSVDLEMSIFWDANSTVAGLRVPSRAEVLDTLHDGADVYTDPTLIRLKGLLTLESRAHSPTPRPMLIRAIVEAIRPTLVVEVGVFKGWTTIAFADEMARLGLESSFVVSIDTWLLDLRFTWSKQQKQQQQLRSYFTPPAIAGGAQAYAQFLHNVQAAGQQARVIPMQSSTSNAAHAFYSHRWQADVVYVDASHSSVEVFMDMEYWWQLVRCGGVLFGDDIRVPSVRVAVSAFVRKHRLKLETKEFRGTKGEGGFWLLEKSGAA
ncbi:hypothetical protein T492DRAFT_920200, partial [Pavlovales sp. CCMP2436]